MLSRLYTGLSFSPLPSGRRRECAAAIGANQVSRLKVSAGHFTHPRERRISRSGRDNRIPLHPAWISSCLELYMAKSESTHGTPKRTTELLDTLVRASAGGPQFVDLQPWLPTPFICRSNVAPVLPSSRCFVEFMLTQKLEGRTILDFGSGSGILAVMAQKLGATTVDAIDINPEAVAATKENACRYGFANRITAIQSDGFKSLSGKYDLILANLPMVDDNTETGVLFGLFDPQFALHRHFFSQLRQYLKPGGSAVICHSEFQEDWPFPRLDSLIRQHRLQSELVFQKAGEAVDWQLYRITPAEPSA